MATGTLTQTISRGRHVDRVTLAWTSTSTGAVSDTVPLDGQVLRAVFVPSATVAPSANYDVTLTDTAGVDILSGQGANLSATATSEVCPTCAATDGTTTGTAVRGVNDACTLTIANAGSAKQGTIYLYLKP